MKNTCRFKNNVSHSWWEELITITGNTTSKWLDNEGKKIDANSNVDIANAQANAEAAKAALEAEKNENSKRTMLYVGIGGVVLVVLLFLVIALKK